MAKQPIIKHKGIVMSLSKKIKGGLDSYRMGEKVLFSISLLIFLCLC